MVAAPMVVCVKPTVFERIFFGFMACHFFMMRSIPAMKSSMPMARNSMVNTEVVAGSAKTVTSIMFSKIRKIAPVKIRLVTIRKPPMARLSLTSFRIQFTPRLITRRKLEQLILCWSRFNTFASSKAVQSQS
jgi:hypothetical protein